MSSWVHEVIEIRQKFVEKRKEAKFSSPKGRESISKKPAKNGGKEEELKEERPWMEIASNGPSSGEIPLAFEGGTKFRMAP